MNSLTKVILATSLISTVGLGGLAVEASIKNQANPTTSQRANATKIAEASDGDGEMDDALEAQLEQENPRADVSSDRTQKVSEDKDGGAETREIPNEPNDTDGGDETQESR